MFAGASKFLAACVGGSLAVVSLASAQSTVRVSVDSSGIEGGAPSGSATISRNGRWIAFWSRASNLVAGDSGYYDDSFVHDRATGATIRVSVDPSGAEGNGGSSGGSISGDGRFVAFVSWADNLVASDTNLRRDAFVRDLQTGTTELVSVDSAGVQANNSTSEIAISADGRFVAFVTRASNLFSGDTNYKEDLFLRDRQAGTTVLVSVDSSGNAANGNSGDPAISADGRYVAFWSEASDLVAVDTNNRPDVFVRDMQTGTTELVSVDASGNQANDPSRSRSISADGRFVAFESKATNLVPGDTNRSYDAFVRDRQTGSTECVSVDSSGTPISGSGPFLSADGRFVAFTSGYDKLVPNDTNVAGDVFVRDRQAGTTVRVDLSNAGKQANHGAGADAISADGRFVASESISVTLVPNDTNNSADVFVHGPWLGLDVEPTSVAPNAPIMLAAWEGQPAGAFLLAAVELNGTPLFVPVLLDVFDANGRWNLAATVPPGLSGITVKLQGFGIAPTAKLAVTGTETVEFQ
jgi:Tol biopolymer transport system component